MGCNNLASHLRPAKCGDQRVRIQQRHRIHRHRHTVTAIDKNHHAVAGRGLDVDDGKLAPIVAAVGKNRARAESIVDPAEAEFGDVGAASNDEFVGRWLA